MSSSSSSHRTYSFTNLVFSGGGVRGCGYAKLWSVLEEYGIAPQIKAVIGVSAGSIIAGMIAMGCSGKEIEEMVRTMNFGDFADNSFGITLDIYRLISRFGWNKGDVFLDWYGAIIAKRFHHPDGRGNPDATLKEVFDATGIEFNAISTCLELEKGRVFNYKTDPNLPFRKLVRMSISVPGFFLPVIHEGYTYVDGGVVNNYPIWYFDSVKPDYHEADSVKPNSSTKSEKSNTIGFRLIGNPRSSRAVSLSREITLRDTTSWQSSSWQSSSWQWVRNRIFGTPLSTIKRITNIKDYVSSLISTMIHTIESSAMHDGYWERTVRIDTDVIGSIDFNPDPELVEVVINNGERALRAYLDSYSTD